MYSLFCNMVPIKCRYLSFCLFLMHTIPCNKEKECRIFFFFFCNLQLLIENALLLVVKESNDIVPCTAVITQYSPCMLETHLKKINCGRIRTHNRAKRSGALIAWANRAFSFALSKQPRNAVIAVYIAILQYILIWQQPRRGKWLLQRMTVAKALYGQRLPMPPY